MGLRVGSMTRTPTHAGALIQDVSHPWGVRAKLRNTDCDVGSESGDMCPAPLALSSVDLVAIWRAHGELICHWVECKIENLHRPTYARRSLAAMAEVAIGSN
ncbi:unnamed protein product, partial [Iphiclides podalirius]